MPGIVAVALIVAIVAENARLQVVVNVAGVGTIGK
jgi:hypothetical protein